MKTYILTPLAGCLIAALATAPATAQSDANGDGPQRERRNVDVGDRDADRARASRRDRRSMLDRRDEDERSSRRDRRDGRDSARSDQRSSERSDDQRAEPRDSRRSERLQPSGWIAVAYDYDNDGFYEGADWIYYYDLQGAQERSRQRASAEQQASRQRDSRGSQANSQRNRETIRIRGEIVSMETKNMMGSSRRDDVPHLFARVETESGRTARVCLGKEAKIDELDLREGDRIEVVGVQARVDDETVLLARRVSAGGETITTDVPRRENWLRVRGTVRSVSHTASGEREERHTVVKVKSPERRVLEVDLGPSADIEQLDIQEGDEIAVLGRTGRIDDESLLIAQLVRVGDETVDVRESTNRSLRSARERDRQERRRPLRDRWNR